LFKENLWQKSLIENIILTTFFLRFSPDLASKKINPIPAGVLEIQDTPPSKSHV